MNLFEKFIVLSLPCVALLTGALWAQGNSVTYSPRPFDPSTSMLEPMFYGNDPEPVFSALKDGLKKSEFESTDEYNLRVQQMVSAFASMYGFQIQDSEVLSYYDADSHSLEVYIRLWPQHKQRKVLDDICAKVNPAEICYFDQSYVSGYEVPLKTRTTNLGNYVGENAMGATRLVESRSRSEYGVEFQNIDEFPIASKADIDKLRTENEQSVFFVIGTGEDPIIFVRLNMDPMEAKAAKSNLHVLALCRLIPPYVSSDMGAHTATIAEPYDLVTDLNYLQGRVFGLWLYDLPSGRIFAKLSATEKPVTPSPESIAKQESEECNTLPAQSKCRVLAAGMLEKNLRKGHADARVILSDDDNTTLTIQEMALDDKKVRAAVSKEAQTDSDFQKSFFCFFGFKRMILKPLGSDLPSKELNIHCPDTDH